MKIFEKCKDGNRRNCYLFGRKFLSYKKMNSNLENKSENTQNKDFDMYDYCKNYKYVLDSFIDNKEEEQMSDYIWQYWGQGLENAPELVKKCFESVRKCCPNNKVIILDDSNISNFIEIPDYIQEKLDKGIISKTHFSDYVRTCLLVKYGGTWIDATVYLTDIIPSEIVKSDFFVFKPLAYSECRNVPSLKMLKLLNRIPTYLSPFLCLSSWFIHSKPNDRILILTKRCLEEYWFKENTLIDYFLYHYFVTFLILNDKKCREIYETMPNLANRNPHLLQNVLLDQFDKDLFDELKQLSSIHKLTYKISSDSNTFLEYIKTN